MMEAHSHRIKVDFPHPESAATPMRVTLLREGKMGGGRGLWSGLEVQGKKCLMKIGLPDAVVANG
jgi:hypothetical protein